jgi:hypothetical protein
MPKILITLTVHQLIRNSARPDLMKAAEGQTGVLCENTETWTTTELEDHFQIYAVDIRPFHSIELLLRSDK